MNKVVRDGKVAVLVSPNFGAGWSTWADSEVSEKLLFEPEVVAWVEDGKKGTFPNLEEKYSNAYFCKSDINDLEIEWVPVGTRFRISEYDGSETLILESEEIWFTA